MAKQPFVPVPGVCRVRFAGLNQGLPWVNGFAISYIGGPPTAADMGGLAAAIRASWVSAFGAWYTTNMSLQTTQVWDISSDKGNSSLNTSPSIGTGAPGTPVPVNCAIAISWPVVSRWRGGHFRTYVPVRGTSDITNGRTVVTGTRDSLQLAAQNFLTSVNQIAFLGGTAKLCGVRYFPVGVDVIKTSGEPFPFASPVVHTRMDSQRRRLGKELV